MYTALNSVEKSEIYNKPIKAFEKEQIHVLFLFYTKFYIK